MTTLVWLCLFASLPTLALGLSSNQLYTGTPSTIPPGRTQVLGFTDGARPSQARVGGIQIRPGITGNMDAKAAYSYLWNSNGPNAQFGPNVGVKWRFAGDGWTNPSLAVSAQYAISQGGATRNHKGDWGFAIIGLYPTRQVSAIEYQSVV